MTAVAATSRRLGRARRDRELEVGSAAHYEDPAYYEATYRRRTADVAFYVERVRAAGGSALELGCGNGRITLPLARAGAEVVGLDPSRPMLADLRARLRAEPAEVRARVQLVRGDMRTRRLGRRFRTVLCPFNALLHLYTRPDLERAFARVREHLAPRGRFLLDVSIPEPLELARRPEVPHRVPPFTYPGVGKVRYAERFDYDRLRQILFVSMEFSPASGGPPFVTPLAHRQLHPQELEALLHYNGFAVDELIGDFQGPPTQETSSLVFVCRARRGRQG